MGRRIYKFQDNVDFESAFIVADSYLDAENFLKGETSLDISFVKDVSIDDFPRANINKPVPYSWINRINPF